MKKLIFDTDIGGDCDDAGALALIHSLCDRGEAELLAVTATYDNGYVAGCIDAINSFFGRRVPVGVCYARTMECPETGYHGYAKDIFEKFDHDYKRKKAEDSLTVLRKALASAEDHSVTLICTGTCSCLAQLVLSKGDKISELSGMELIRRKAERTVVMGGRFKETWPMPIIEFGVGELHAEYNIKGDVKAAQTVCDNWPGELVFSSYEIGNYCITLKNLAYSETNPNPVALAYQLFPWREAGRESWDLTAALYAIRPEYDYYNLHKFGKVSVSDDGITTWQESDQFCHSYLMPKADYQAVEQTIDSLIEQHQTCRRA